MQRLLDLMIQVSDDISRLGSFTREYDPLLKIKDATRS